MIFEGFIKKTTHIGSNLVEPPRYEQSDVRAPGRMNTTAGLSPIVVSAVDLVCILGISPNQEYRRYSLRHLIKHFGKEADLLAGPKRRCMVWRTKVSGHTRLRGCTPGAKMRHQWLRVD